MTLKRLEHVSLPASNLEVSTEFYSDFLGLALVPRPDFGFAGTWFSITDGQLLHLIQKDHIDHDTSSRSAHIAFEVDDLDQWVEKAREAEIIVRGPKTRADGSQHVFITDPDGFWIELVQLLA